MKNKGVKYLSVAIVVIFVFCGATLTITRLWQRPPSPYEAIHKELGSKTTISDTEAASINNAQTSAEQLYQQLLSSKGKKKAIADVVTYLKGLPIVEDAGASEAVNSIWIKYKNGIKGVILTSPPSTKGIKF